MIVFLWFFSDAMLSPFLNKERGLEYSTTLMSVHLFVYTIAGVFQGWMQNINKKQVLLGIVACDLLQLYYMYSYTRANIFYSTPLFFLQIILYKRYIICDGAGQDVEGYMISAEKKIALGLSSGYLCAIFLNTLDMYLHIGCLCILCSLFISGEKLYKMYVEINT